MDSRFFEYRGSIYPSCLKEGHGAAFILPIAQQFCIGNGLDIGGTDDCHFPDARVVNKNLPDGFHALNIPPGEYDYIFSSHTLEHIFECGAALKYWKEHLKKNGVLFLYLPHPDMLYWRPESCKKHINSFTPPEITSLLYGLNFDMVLCSERDLFWSFAVVATNNRR